LWTTEPRFRRQHGAIANQLKKAMAVADIKFGQWFSKQASTSLSMKVVMPADAHAAVNISVPVICIEQYQGQKG
jgi:hypothetical protein